MTVSELIEELQKLPPYWPVVIESPSDVYEIVKLQAITSKAVHE